MGRPLRVRFPGAVYHVMARGNEKREIFRQPGDQQEFLRTLVGARDRFAVEIVAYCLMPNHIHLLLHTPTAEGNVSDFMKRLLGLYTMYFNQRYARVGHLFQGRYKALLVDRETYLLEVSRYIHLNPCRGGLSETPEAYPWSSISEYLGLRNLGIAAPDLVMRRFEGGGPYLEFVMAGLGMSRDMLSEVKAGLFLGSEGFVEEMKTRVRGQVEPNVSQRAELLRKTPVSAGIASSQRDLQVYAMHRWFGKKQREIGELFGLTQSAVSQTLRRLESKLPQNPNLQAELDALRKRLS